MKITINETVAVDSDEITVTASRSSGPGGQNVNRVATKVTLRFDVARSRSLADGEKARIMKALRKQITAEGELVIHEERARTQGANRKLALEKFAESLARALKKRKKRVASRVNTTDREKRLTQKKRESGKKTARKKVDDGQD